MQSSVVILTLFAVVVIIVYVLRTSHCGLVLHFSRFCSRQNRKTCIKYMRDNTDTRREEIQRKCGTDLIGVIAVSGSQSFML